MNADEFVNWVKEQVEYVTVVLGVQECSEKIDEILENCFEQLETKIGSQCTVNNSHGTQLLLLINGSEYTGPQKRALVQAVSDAVVRSSGQLDNSHGGNRVLQSNLFAEL